MTVDGARVDEVYRLLLAAAVDADRRREDDWSTTVSGRDRRDGRDQ